MGLVHPDAFFAQVRACRLLGPSLEQSEVDGINAILTACEGWPAPWTAYALATTWHESAHTMQPVREIGSDAYLQRMYDPLGLRPAVARALGNTEPGDGVRFCGRGYVQLTGRANYMRAGLALGMNLIAGPEMALEPCTAAAILRDGMKLGWFSGKTLADFLPRDEREATIEQFRAARAIINGHDDELLIADAALAFQGALTAGAWPLPFVPAPTGA